MYKKKKKEYVIKSPDKEFTGMLVFKSPKKAEKYTKKKGGYVIKK